MNALKELAVFLILLAASARAGADKPKAEVVPIPPKIEKPAEEDVLRITIHKAEGVAEIDLVIGLECDVKKLIAKYGDLKPDNEKGWKKLMELVGEKLKERGEFLLKERVQGPKPSPLPAHPHEKKEVKPTKAA